ncbi:MAG: hypothetical protein ABIG61_00485 [Planctomycetota bacterium]
MNGFVERRGEKRLRYHWPIWFAENINDVLQQGQMVDISSQAAAFTCYADQCPYPSQNLGMRFSVPLYHPDDTFDLQNFIRQGHIQRIDQINPFLRRIVVRFTEPLPFQPGRQENIQADQIFESSPQTERTEEAEAYA